MLPSTLQQGAAIAGQIFPISQIPIFGSGQTTIGQKRPSTGWGLTTALETSAFIPSAAARHTFLLIFLSFMAVSNANSTRISKRFAELRASGELGIVGYITAGDPSLDASLRFVLALAEAGPDVVQLGLPFTDPLPTPPPLHPPSPPPPHPPAPPPGL